MSRTRTMAQHYARLLSQWPKDAIRPEVQFQNVLRARSTAPPAPTPSSSSSSSSGTAAATAPATTRKSRASAQQQQQQQQQATREEQLDLALGPRRARPAAEEAQVNALYSLIEERYSGAYPVPASVRRPLSDPDYYDRLLRQLDETPRRGWFDNVALRLRGMVRFS